MGRFDPGDFAGNLWQCKTYKSQMSLQLNKNSEQVSVSVTHEQRNSTSELRCVDESAIGSYAKAQVPAFNP